MVGSERSHYRRMDRSWQNNRSPCNNEEHVVRIESDITVPAFDTGADSYRWDMRRGVSRYSVHWDSKQSEAEVTEVQEHLIDNDRREQALDNWRPAGRTLLAMPMGQDRADSVRRVAGSMSKELSVGSHWFVLLCFLVY